MSDRLDSELLRTFVTIAETGSFTKAADELFRTQSTISMQVKKLEEVVGRALFLRQARGVSLTPEGSSFLEDARRIVKLIHKAENSFRHKDIKGVVKVGIPEEYGLTTLPHILAEFSQNFPDIEISVRCEPSDNFSDYIDQAELDLAVVVSDPGHERGDILFHDPTLWVTSREHLTHEETPLPLAVFEQCLWREWVLDSMDKAGRDYRVVYSSASVSGISAAVTSGLAVGVLCQSTLPRGVRVLTPAEGFPQLPGANVTLQRREKEQSEAAERMASAILNAFKSEPAFFS